MKLWRKKRGAETEAAPELNPEQTSEQGNAAAALAAFPASVRAVLPETLRDPQKMRAFWPKFWRTVGRVPFSEDLVAAWYCWADPKTPARVRAVLGGALLYFVIPTDLAPDMIVGLGFTDDATVLATAIGVAGAHIKRRHRQAARKLLNRGAKDVASAPEPV